MDNPQANLYASAASEAPPAPIQGRPAHKPGDLPAPPPEGVTEQPTRPKRPNPLTRLLAARWVLAVPAIALALYAGQLTEQTRTSFGRPLVPPVLIWQLLGLAGLLLAIAVWPYRALLPAIPDTFRNNLRAMSLGRRKLFLI